MKRKKFLLSLSISLLLTGSLFTIASCNNDNVLSAKTGTVVISENENGIVVASAISGNVGDIITLTVTPNDGYVLDTLTANGVDIKNSKQFALIEGENIVIATFIEDTTKKEASVTNPIIIDGVDLDSVATKLSKPFYIYEEDGSTPTNLEYDNKSLSSNEFDNLYMAIRVAGLNSSTKRKLQVQDSNFVQVFIKQKTSKWFVFNGHDYVGTELQKKAKLYVEANENAYAIGGDGSSYKRLGRSDYSENMELYDASLEYNAGAYNYMFSKTGVAQGENGSNLNGFSYAKATVRLSEMTYRASQDGTAWNAYIFFNIASVNHSDLGLIGGVSGDTLTWRLFRSCGSSSHGSAGFTVTQPMGTYVTSTTKYNYVDYNGKKVKEFYGCDDLEFEAVGYSYGWILNITNLATGKVYSINDLHYNDDGTKLVENEEANNCYYRVLVASSYCPVVGNVWNWDSGASTHNVIWDNIKIARYIDDDIESYRKDDVEFFELYPDSELLRDGYSQGAFASSFEYKTHESDGTYKSGNSYKKGDKYLSLSVDYTNEWE